MVPTPRSTVPDDEPDDEVARPDRAFDVTETAAEILRGAMRAFEAAHDERLRLRKLAIQISMEREYLDRRSAQIEEEELIRKKNEELSRLETLNTAWKQAEVRSRTERRSLVRSLQFVAGCALAGVVLTGIFFGHDIRGFDPGYAGGAIGLLAGTGVWVIRGL